MDGEHYTTDLRLGKWFDGEHYTSDLRLGTWFDGERDCEDVLNPGHQMFSGDS